MARMRAKSDAEFLRDLKTGPLHEDLVVVGPAVVVGGVVGWALGGLWSMFRDLDLGAWVRNGGGAMGTFALTVVLSARIWP